MKQNPFLIIGVSMIIVLAGILTGVGILNVAGSKANQFVGSFRLQVDSLTDQTYTGRYSVWGLTAAEVSFTVASGKLKEFRLNRVLSTPGYGIRQKITDTVTVSGNLDFDAISQATVSSNFVKAAIKDAVQNVTE